MNCNPNCNPELTWTNLDQINCPGQWVEPPVGIEPTTCSLRGDRTPPTTGVYQRQQLQITHLWVH
jgi:hypothetical protein